MKKIASGFVTLVLTIPLHAEDLPQFLLEDVVVTATRFEESYRDKPVNMTIITESDIKHSAAKSLPELLGEQPGINTRDFFGTNGSNATVDMRGFGATGGQNTQILLDGRKITDIDLSGVQWPALPIAVIERVEILRGGGAVLYGDGTTAGVINIVTKSPAKLGNRFDIGGSYGSYSTGEAHLNANYISGEAGMNITASHYDSKSYRDNNHNRQSNLFGDFHWGTAKNEAWIKIGGDEQNLRLPGGRFVQPSIGLNELQTNRRGASTPLDYATRDGQHLDFGWRARSDGREINLDFGYRDKNQTAYFDFGGFPDYRETNLKVWSFTPRVKFDHSGFGFPSTLIVGIDWYRWDYELKLSNSPLNIGQPINTISASQENSAFYLQNSTALNKKTNLTLGLRHERFKLNSQDGFDPSAPGGAFGSAATPANQIENQNAYEVGLRHQASQATALIVRVGRSYRFANVDEIYEFSPAFSREFQLLRPQTAQNQELAIEFNKQSIFARASLFRIDVKDEIHLDAFSSGVGNTNLPPSRRDGLELEARWSPASRFVFSGAYTYLRPKFLEGVLPGSAFTTTNVIIRDKTVPLVPKHKLNLNASWTIQDQTTLNAALSYVGEQFMENDEANNLGVTIPAYTVADLKLTSRVGQWTFQAAINNLFNRKYFDYAIRSQFVVDRYSAYPLPERNATVALEYTFK